MAAVPLGVTAEISERHFVPSQFQEIAKGTGEEWDRHYRRMVRDFGLEPEEDLDKKKFKLKSSKPL